MKAFQALQCLYDLLRGGIPSELVGRPKQSSLRLRSRRLHRFNRSDRSLDALIDEPIIFSGGGFDDWVVGPQFEPYSLHHPVCANRRFPIRRQIGRFRGDFRPLNSRILVSGGVRTFLGRFLAPCLRIKKFRSRQPWLSAKSDRIAPGIPRFGPP
jgi:hypothetical protein